MCKIKQEGHLYLFCFVLLISVCSTSKLLIALQVHRPHQRDNEDMTSKIKNKN